MGSDVAQRRLGSEELRDGYECGIAGTYLGAAFLDKPLLKR